MAFGGTVGTQLVSDQDPPETGTQETAHQHSHPYPASSQNPHPNNLTMPATYIKPSR